MDLDDGRRWELLEDGRDPDDARYEEREDGREPEVAAPAPARDEERDDGRPDFDARYASMSRRRLGVRRMTVSTMRSPGKRSSYWQSSRTPSARVSRRLSFSMTRKKSRQSFDTGGSGSASSTKVLSWGGGWRKLSLNLK